MSDVSDVASGAASTGAGIISDLGVGSSLNVNSIISQLMEVQDEPVTLLQNQEAADQTTVSAYGSLQSALATFQSSLEGLTNLNQYQSLNATVGDTSVATATATSTAAAGNYSLQVTQLAQAQTLVAAGQASTTSVVGAGTISFTFGTTTGTATNGQYGAGTTFTNAGAAPSTVTISSSDDTLAGIASAINSANIGVKASILNDGSGTPYRLSLTSTNTGAASSMQISVSGDTALQNLLNQNPTSTTGQNLTQTSAAEDAQFELNGLAISSATNTDSTVVPGVTLNLLATNSGSPTTLTVAQDNSGATTAINSFVSAYNTVEGAIASATAAKTSTTAAGPLQGKDDVLSISTQMQSLIDSPIPGATSTLSMLGQIGVTFQSDGTLSVDSATLQTALNANPNAVTGLFASNGTASDSLINYTGSTTSTQPGVYAVNISQLATEGTTVGSAAANTTITAGVNDTLSLNLNGLTENITLAAGTYTAASLATALQTAINTNTGFTAAGDSASVSQNAGVFSISSNLYGSKSVASVTGGNGETDLLGSAATATTGLDVAGTIGGNAATGSGQSLTGSVGATTGLSIQINGGSTGDRGSINYTQGIVSEMNNLMASTLSSSGAISAETTQLQSTIKGYQNSITADSSLNQQVLTSLQAEYSALDVTLSNLTSTSNFLTQQLATSSSSSSSG